VSGETLGANGRTVVDALYLEGFKLTLDGRLSEAHAIRTNLVEQLRRTPPQLGTLQDADYVRDRYVALYDQHVDRLSRLIDSIEVTLQAITTIINNYATNEALLVADAKDIADALDSVSGVPDGDRTDAG
jgi:hypothetical protein